MDDRNFVKKALFSHGLNCMTGCVSACYMRLSH